MNILLIDADSTIPNIALMKLSAWHKANGDNVTLIILNIPYYPSRKKKFFSAPEGFDKIYCSVIFEGNSKFVLGKNIIFGGTGFNLTTVLPDVIENYSMDYSIYPQNNISFGFITRGCIRNCYFCKVPKKEGYIRKVACIKDIVKHKKVMFLDNNILAYNKHKEILRELIKNKICCQFTQGLDIRLVDIENSLLLSQLNYFGWYTFAFDSLKDKYKIEEKLKLMTWRKPFQLRFFVYISPKMPLSETIKRVIYLKQNLCVPYIMRDIRCYKDIYANFFTDVAAYCNQVHVFKKLDFLSYLEKRHTKKDRILSSSILWNKNQL